MTLAEMVQTVGLEIGLRLVQEPIGSSDFQLQQLVALFNREVYQLGTRYRWQALTHEATFVTQNQEDQGAFIGGILSESDHYNFIISETMWDRTARQPICGPESSFDWQARHALSYTSGPFPEYRLRNNRFLMLPIPAAGHDIYFEFASKKFVYDPQQDTHGPKFTSNDSVPVLDPELIMEGVRWRWKELKGFAYQEAKRQYEVDCLNASSRDSGKKRLSISGGNSLLAGRRGGDITTTAI